MVGLTYHRPTLLQKGKKFVFEIIDTVSKIKFPVKDGIEFSMKTLISTFVYIVSG